MHWTRAFRRSRRTNDDATRRDEAESLEVLIRVSNQIKT